MPEQCARASIPGDPEAIHAAARGLERDVERAGEEILANIGQARESALAGWSAPSAEEFGAFVARGLSFETDQIEAKRAAAQIWHVYAEELRAAQRALEQATENEQSAERASERAEEDSRAEGKAEDAARDAREDQVSAARDAAAAAERAAQAMERVIDGLAAVPQGPGSPGPGTSGSGFELDHPPTVPLDGLYGGARGSEEWYKHQRSNLSRNHLRPTTHAAGLGPLDEGKGSAHRSAARRVSQARSTATTIGRFARPLGPIGTGADFVGNVAQGRGVGESAGRAAISAATTGLVVAGAAGACGALSFGLLAAACGVGVGAAGSYLGGELGDRIFGED